MNKFRSLSLQCTMCYLRGTQTAKTAHCAVVHLPHAGEHFIGELLTNSKHAKWEFEERSCIMQPRTSYRFGQDKDITTYQMSWGVLFWRAAVSNDGCHHLHGSPPHLVSADNQKRTVGALKLCIKKTRLMEMNVDTILSHLTEIVSQ